jgi:hypothetical protein
LVLGAGVELHVDQAAWHLSGNVDRRVAQLDLALWPGDGRFGLRLRRAVLVAARCDAGEQQHTGEGCAAPRGATDLGWLLLAALLELIVHDPSGPRG